MKLKDFKQLDKTERDLLMMYAVHGNQSRQAYHNAIINMTARLHLPIGETKQLSSILFSEFQKTASHSLHQQLKISELAATDTILQQLDVFYESVIPQNIPAEAFKRYLEKLNEVGLYYASRAVKDRKMPANKYHILTMIYNNQLADFFERFFTAKEGSVCSADKANFVVNQLESAIITDDNLPLVEHFGPKEKASLAGKRTYWSTDAFQDTNEVIKFLTKQFYL